MGGVLAVAGVPGFLGNVDEMLEAADAEGAIWRAFVGRWWEIHRSGAVGVGDLYKIALITEPHIPLGDGSERSQKTRLGKSLGRMRDREPEDAKLVWARAEGSRWKLICWRFGISRATADRRWEYALSLIAWRLNGRQVPSKRSRRYLVERVRAAPGM